jgi:T5SS/PEP-CTERM-associated repeat protein
MGVKFQTIIAVDLNGDSTVDLLATTNSHAVQIQQSASRTANTMLSADINNAGSVTADPLSDSIGLSINQTTVTPPAIQVGPLFGLDYSPFRGAETPLSNPPAFPTADEMIADLPILARMGNAVRLYSVTNGFDVVIQQAPAHGLKVVPSAWISTDAGANQTEMDALVSALGTAPANSVPFAVVGSEVLQRGDLTVDQLVADIQYVRNNAPAGTLITTADTWYELATHADKLAPVVDVVFVNIFPYWEAPDAIPADQAVAFIVEKYQLIQSLYPGKPVILSEVGWPSAGAERTTANQGDPAVPSVANEEAFWTAFVPIAKQMNISFFGFEAFDESWKSAVEPPTGPDSPGPHWGIDDEARTAKGSIVAIEPRDLLWTGASGTDPANPANWIDQTDGSIAAPQAPDLFDTLHFESASGAIGGPATAAAIDVGLADSGVLQLSGTAALSAGSLVAGGSAGAVGQIGLAGANVRLSVTGDAVVADDGTGVLSVLSGATFFAANLTIGARGDSSGAAVVSGAGSELRIAGALNVGTALGTGDLTVGPGAAVHASVVNLHGPVVLEGGLLDPAVTVIDTGRAAGGFGTLAADVIIDEGLIQATEPRGLLLVQGTLEGGGTLARTVSGQPTIVNDGTGAIEIGAGATLELTGPVLNGTPPALTDSLTPAGTYAISSGAIDISFADATGVLILDDIGGFAGTIAAAQSGDRFIVPGGALANLNFSDSGTLTFADSGPRAGVGGIDTIIFASAMNPGDFEVVNGDTIDVMCFAEGTRIETIDGPVAVEHLIVGDRIVTAEGEVERVSRLHSWAVDRERHSHPETLWPVRVMAGALGENIPSRDLYLSPGHAVLIGDVLVPVKLLVNGTSIARVVRRGVVYHHVELARHQVILAEGLPVESYLRCGERVRFQTSDGTMRTCREDMAAALAWETGAVAPLVLCGKQLDMARRAIEVTRPMIHLSHVVGEVAVRSAAGESVATKSTFATPDPAPRARSIRFAARPRERER